MAGVSYDHIYALIARTDQDGAFMKVCFRCPVTGAAVESRSALRKADNMATRAAAGARRRMAWSVRTAVANAAYRAMGGGAAGQLAAGAASDATTAGGASASYSDAEKKAAIIEAFEAVANQFVWDAHAGRYISFQAAGEVMPEFMQQLNSFPVEAPYDRQICARMLTEIACADGHLGEDERGFLAGFVTTDLGTVDGLAQLPQLTAAELAETSRSHARDTLLMLAWSLALSDEEIAPEERARLAEIAAGLGVAEPRAGQLEQYAKLYVVDQALRAAFTGGGHDADAHAAAVALGRRLGLADSDIERADLRVRRRYGFG